MIEDEDVRITADPELLHLARVVAILIRHSSRRVRKEIAALLDQEDAMADAGHGADEALPIGNVPPEPEPEPELPIGKASESPRYDESQELDRSAPIGDRMFVPQWLLDRDGKNVTFRGIDPETGAVVEGTAPLVIAPEHFKEAARRRGVDVDAS